MPAAMKRSPDDENEIHDLTAHTDPGNCVVTPVAHFPARVARTVTDALRHLVQAAHRSPAATTPNEDGITRAQTFEEGEVYMLGAPFTGYPADRYLMDFYDVVERDICSRMHLHTGLRYVRMMTGPGTRIRVASLAPIHITHVPGVTAFLPETFEDDYPDAPEDQPRTRHNLVIPPNSWADMQIPRGVSHQFNAHGPHAVIDSVHPEESIETLREHMTGYRMMAQTIFLADEQPPAHSCRLT
ncbi:hypothetical protein [Streptomyces sp. NRRL B-1347]|uniref:hypothetical protein n=1 Tax=Streptomyces sp. NRRL B-1347 TaxID=1476877 RepID=UPI000B2E24CF|nr:hypothetical protein [Streptomyces sp. NRRL B-1347]